MGWLGIALWSVCWSGCEDSEPSVDLVGKIGEKCPVCPETGCDGLSVCECDTCTMRGYDPEARQLLSCSFSGTWQLLRECPGGVSVECDDFGTYRIRCFGVDGGMLPLND